MAEVADITTGSTAATGPAKEGGLGAPTRHPLNQNAPEFWDKAALNEELARVFDICHGCRRCVSLCNAFPTLFDLVDDSATLEVDGVAKADYNKVVDQCYLCDLCYLTKCPYVPPHEWNVDFPHLMLRAKAVKFKQGDTKFRDRLITSTDTMGKLAAQPGLNTLVTKGAESSSVRQLLDRTLGIHAEAKLPPYQRHPARAQQAVRIFDPATSATAAELPAGATAVNAPAGAATTDATAVEASASTIAADAAATTATPTIGTAAPPGNKVALFTTCYCNYNEPDLADRVIKVLEHNGVTVHLPAREHCCGMPKLELGDLATVTRLMEQNIPVLQQLVQAGYSLLAAVPSCVLMFKQELPLMFPEHAPVQAVARAFYDPFEYLHRLHKAGRLRTDFKNSLGAVSYHVACHQRVQNIGPRTRQILELIPHTTVTPIERCSGHDGTYGVKSESFKFANKIAAPVVRQIRQQQPDYYSSDCPVAGRHLEHNLAKAAAKAAGQGGQSKPGERAKQDPPAEPTHQPTTHPIDLLCLAYGI